MAGKYGLIFTELDNIIIDNYWRKFYTYRELGWDDNSIKAYLAQKQYVMQIASFNTAKVSFSASSRRNRYYEVFNRLDMLEKDIAYGQAIDVLDKLAEKYDIFIISSRTTDLEEKTLETMRKLNFNLDKYKVIFKKPLDVLHTYRQKCFDDIKQTNPTGFAVCLMPGDATMVERNNYTPIGFTSVKEAAEFNGTINTVCEDWIQLVQALWI
jgi:tetratricopeptide (TPR) repeat protein